MFDWTNEVILNKVVVAEVADRTNAKDATIAKDATVVTDAKGSAEHPSLIIKRGGEYFIDRITGKKLHVTKGTAGKCGKATIKLAEAGISKGDVCNLLINIQMDDRYYGEFANANYQHFGKPVMVEFEVGDDIVADAVAAITEAVPADNVYLTAEKVGANLVVTCASEYAAIKSVTVRTFVAACGLECEKEYAEVDMAGKLTIEDNVRPFGTAAWIQENLRFPSYPNLRYAGQFEDERPVAGKIYDQVAFTYTVPERGHGGLNFVGEAIVSTTTHVFYVDSALTDTFLDAFGSTVTVCTEEMLPAALTADDTDHEDVHAPVEE